MKIFSHCNLDVENLVSNIKEELSACKKYYSDRISYFSPFWLSSFDIDGIAITLNLFLFEKRIAQKDLIFLEDSRHWEYF